MSATTVRSDLNGQRLKKQGLVRYTICGWMPKE